MYDKYYIEQIDSLDDDNVKEKFCDFYDKYRTRFQDIEFYFVEIFGGRRWSYICGYNFDISVHPLRIIISKKFGICLHSNKNLTINDRCVQELLNLLRNYFLENS